MYIPISFQISKISRFVSFRLFLTIYQDFSLQRYEFVQFLLDLFTKVETFVNLLT